MKHGISLLISTIFLREVRSMIINYKSEWIGRSGQRFEKREVLHGCLALRKSEWNSKMQ